MGIYKHLSFYGYVLYDHEIVYGAKRKTLPSNTNKTRTDRVTPYSIGHSIIDESNIIGNGVEVPTGENNDPYKTTIYSCSAAETSAGKY